MGVIERVDAIVRPEAPAERLAAVRILVGAFAIVYLVIRAASLASVAHQDADSFSPAGPARLLAAPLPSGVVYALVAVTIVLSIPFVLGLFFRFTAPAFAACLLWVLAYRNSFGMIFHTENLLVMHVIVLAMTDCSAAWSLDARRSGTVAPPSRRFGFALQCMGAITAVAYVLAGIAKLRISGIHWATGDTLRNQVAHDNLRKLLLGDSYSRIGAWAARHAWVFRPFAVLTLFIELLAPVVLLRGRIAKVWVLLAWSFHAGVLAMMWILFPYQLFFVAFASIFDAEVFIRKIGLSIGRARLAGRVGGE